MDWTILVFDINGKHPELNVLVFMCIVNSCDVCGVFALLDYYATSCIVSVLVVAQLALSFFALSLSNMDLSTWRNTYSNTECFF